MLAPALIQGINGYGIRRPVQYFAPPSETYG